MGGDEAAAPDDSAAGKAGLLPFDPTVAHQARMYDYLLGGKDNYAADRAAMETALKVNPEMAFTARANRAFLGRAVRYLAAEAGIRQFLDIGTGIPTAGNTHEIAQAIAPTSRVVYVDYDPVVLAHARALLNSHQAGATEYIDADLRDTGAVLDGARKVLDFTQPVAVSLISVLHAVPDADDPHAIVARFMDAVPSGSYLALSHLGSDLLGQEAEDGLKDVGDRMMHQKLAARSGEQVARFFAGTDLVAPGLVRVEEWRPGAGPASAEQSSLWCAIGRRR